MFKLPIKINLKNLKSKQKNDAFMTLDIGSNSVKCLIFKIDEDLPNTVKLVGASKQLIEQNVVRSGNILDPEKVAETLDSAIIKASESSDADTANAIFGVGGNLCTGLVTTARVTRDSTNKISSKEEAEISKRINDAAYQKAQERIIKSTGNSDPEIELITTSTVYAKLNGKLVDSLEGQEGQRLEQALFTAFAPTHHLDNIQKIATLLNLNILAVTSNMYALTQTLKRSEGNNLLDGVIIDIGSDTTEVGVILGGGMVSSRNLPIGGNQFTAHLARVTGMTFGEAERKKHGYSFGTLEDSELVRIENALNDVLNIWVSGVELLFSDFNGIKTFPTSIYLTGGTSNLPIILEALETKPWTKSIPFKEPPEFKKMSTKDFRHIHDVTGDIEEAEFINPAALAIIYLELRELLND